MVETLPPVEVIRIQIDEVAVWTTSIVPRQCGRVDLSKSSGDHCDPTSNAVVYIRFQFQRDMCHFESCIPSETRSGVVVYSIKTSVLSRMHGTTKRRLPGVGHRTSSRYRGSPPLTRIQRQSTLELRCILRVRTRTVSQLAEECILQR